MRPWMAATAEALQPLKRWARRQPAPVLRALGKIIHDDLAQTSVADYQPYAPQAIFHMLGVAVPERMFRAGNQQGKTYSAGCEMAFHLTGLYPSWWRGRRWDRPIMGWAAGLTGDATRDNAQRILLGEIGRRGTGTIPAKCLPAGKAHSGLARGVSNLLDWHHVRHISGGWSTLRFRYYAQERQAWQGPPVDLLWLDEEPPEDIYGEALARTIATNGSVMLTFTPLLGMSDVVARYVMENSPHRAEVRMRMVDALHISPERREIEAAKFAPHERKARVDGEIMVGSGRIFPLDDSEVAVKPFQIPEDVWPTMGAIDFGWDHPTAAVKLAWDRDNDVVYITNVYRVNQQTPAMHYAALKHWGLKLPWAWPADGYQTDKGSGIGLAQQYRTEGLALLPKHAQHANLPDDTNTSKVSREVGISEMLSRMMTGRLKVFSHLTDWFEEFRLYHRDNGKIVPKRDDLMDATRYGIMMLRYARNETEMKLRIRHRPAPNWQTGV